jgi:hypothetical protein
LTLLFEFDTILSKGGYEKWLLRKETLLPALSCPSSPAVSTASTGAL